MILSFKRLSNRPPGDRNCMMKPYLKSGIGVFITIALLCIVPDQPSAFGSTLSYWNAALEIGYDPATGRIDSSSAYRQIERWIEFNQIEDQEPILDESLDSAMRETEVRIPTLDAAHFYDQLPYSDNFELWRGIGIRGQVDDDRYHLSIFDPDVVGWIQSTPKIHSKSPVTDVSYGDFEFRAFIRPLSSKSYRFKTESQYYIEDVRYSNVARILKQLADTTWQLAVSREHSLGELNNANRTDVSSSRVLDGLVNDFPHFFSIFNQYFIIKDIVATDTVDRNEPITFDIRITVNMAAVKKDYPNLARKLDRMRGFFHYQSTMFDKQQHPIGRITYDSDKLLLSMRFKTRAGLFLSLGDETHAQNEKPVNITAVGHQIWQTDHTFRFNIAGLKLNIESLNVAMEYYYDEQAANLTAKLRQPPEKITAKGMMLGFLPVWLIDLFIPSNIEDLTQAFFQTLTTGNDGNGTTIIYGSLPEKNHANYVWFATDSEVMSNGTMNFAFNVQRKMDRDDSRLAAETEELSNRLRAAFHKDFLRFKSLNL